MLRPALMCLAVLPAVAGGCSGVNAPSLPSLQAPGTISEAPIVGPPTEVYERIARGVLGCWFGASGPLKKDHIYHAEADPPGKGGKAEIVIHERDRTSDNPKGLRAYRIAITPEDDATTLLFENFKFPEATAKSMEEDARRWGSGAFGCAEAEKGGWSDNKPDAPEAKATGTKKRPSKMD